MPVKIVFGFLTVAKYGKKHVMWMCMKVCSTYIADYIWTPLTIIVYSEVCADVWACSYTINYGWKGC